MLELGTRLARLAADAEEDADPGVEESELARPGAAAQVAAKLRRRAQLKR